MSKKHVDRIFVVVEQFTAIAINPQISFGSSFQISYTYVTSKTTLCRKPRVSVSNEITSRLLWSKSVRMLNQSQATDPPESRYVIQAGMRKGQRVGCIISKWSHTNQKTQERHKMTSFDRFVSHSVFINCINDNVLLHVVVAI